MATEVAPGLEAVVVQNSQHRLVLEALITLAEADQGDTVEESIARGQLRVFYAELWVAYLGENGCVWNEHCTPSAVRVSARPRCAACSRRGPTARGR